MLDSRRALTFMVRRPFPGGQRPRARTELLLQRQADQKWLSRIMHGLLVSRGPSTGQPPSAETIVIGAGDGITPAGELVMLPSDLTIQLSDLAEEESLNLQFGLSTIAAAASAHAHGAVRHRAAAGRVHGQSDHLIPNQHLGTAHDPRRRYRRGYGGLVGAIYKPRSPTPTRRSSRRRQHAEMPVGNAGAVGQLAAAGDDQSGSSVGRSIDRSLHGEAGQRPAISARDSG